MGRSRRKRERERRAREEQERRWKKIAEERRIQEEKDRIEAEEAKKKTPNYAKYKYLTSFRSDIEKIKAECKAKLIRNFDIKLKSDILNISWEANKFLTKDVFKEDNILSNAISDLRERLWPKEPDYDSDDDFDCYYYEHVFSNVTFTQAEQAAGDLMKHYFLIKHEGDVEDFNIFLKERHKVKVIKIQERIEAERIEKIEKQKVKLEKKILSNRLLLEKTIEKQDLAIQKLYDFLEQKIILEKEIENLENATSSTIGKFLSKYIGTLSKKQSELEKITKKIIQYELVEQEGSESVHLISFQQVELTSIYEELEQSLIIGDVINPIDQADETVETLGLDE